MSIQLLQEKKEIYKSDSYLSCFSSTSVPEIHMQGALRTCPCCPRERRRFRNRRIWLHRLSSVAKLTIQKEPIYTQCQRNKDQKNRHTFTRPWNQMISSHTFKLRHKFCKQQMKIIPATITPPSPYTLLQSDVFISLPLKAIKNMGCDQQQ